MNRRELSKALRALLTACALTGTLLVAVSAAQDMSVRISGRVQWIAGGTMIVALDDSPSINVDLSRVAQDQYAGLARGEWAVVIARGLAETTTGTGVTVNSVLVGPTASEGVAQFFDGLAKQQGVSPAELERQFFAAVRPTSRLKRFETPEEVAAV